MAGTMFPGTIVPIIVEGPRPKGYASTFIARVDPREGKKSPRARGWWARIASFKGETVSNERAVTHHPEPTPPLMTYSAEHYNWSSFFCPYCNAQGFIKCMGGHLACDGSVQIRSRGRFHQCFCGNAGFISGTIESFKGTQSTMTIEPPAPMAASERSSAAPTEPNAIALPSTTGISSKRNLP
jgi:hypothetical protein